MEHASGTAAIADPGHGHDFLAQVATGDGHASHHGNQVAEHGNGRDDVQVIEIAEMAGAVFAFGGGIVLGHVLHEDVAWRNALDKERAYVANHGRQPIFFLESVGAAHGNAFLAEAGVQSADNFVLAEEFDHGVFHRAVEAHVVVQVQILLAGQVLLHAGSGGGRTIHVPIGSCTAKMGCATGGAAFAESSALSKISSRSASVAACISRPKISAKCFIKRAATSGESTLRLKSFSTEVALRSAIPQGTIRSKKRKSVETL